MAIFGVWMWPKSVRECGADAVVSRCRRMGVTDIYFLTKGLAGTASYRSQLAPMDCERDLLAELIGAAHPAGIRVHAWFTSASDIVYKDKHPESGRYHYIKGRNQGLISLADEGYIAYMADITREVCRNYDVDGLHLDYIRYNHLVYGWSEDDQARYAAEGADLSVLRALMDRAFKDEEGPEIFFEAYRAGDASVHALARARRKDVVHFASTLTSAARAERGDLILTAALMPVTIVPPSVAIAVMGRTGIAVSVTVMGIPVSGVSAEQDGQNCKQAQSKAAAARPGREVIFFEVRIVMIIAGVFTQLLIQLVGDLTFQVHEIIVCEGGTQLHGLPDQLGANLFVSDFQDYLYNFLTGTYIFKGRDTAAPGRVGPIPEGIIKITPLHWNSPFRMRSGSG